jgi:hypothetical protein
MSGGPCPSGGLEFTIASDCKTVVTTIVEGSIERYGAVIKEIKERSALLQESSFVFEGHASNFEAHNLARFARGLDVGRHVWLGNPFSSNIHVNIMIHQ